MQSRIPGAGWGATQEGLWTSHSRVQILSPSQCGARRGSQETDAVVKSPSIYCHSCKDRPEGERQGSLGEGAGGNDEGLSHGGDSGGGPGERGGARKRKVSSRIHVGP